MSDEMGRSGLIFVLCIFLILGSMWYGLHTIDMYIESENLKFCTDRGYNTTMNGNELNPDNRICCKFAESNSCRVYIKAEAEWYRA